MLVVFKSAGVFPKNEETEEPSRVQRALGRE